MDKKHIYTLVGLSIEGKKFQDPIYYGIALSYSSERDIELAVRGFSTEVAHRLDIDKELVTVVVKTPGGFPEDVWEGAQKLQPWSYWAFKPLTQHFVRGKLGAAGGN